MNEKLRRRLAVLEATRAKGVVLAATGEPGAMAVEVNGRSFEQAGREASSEFFARVRKFATSGRRYRYAVICAPVDCLL
jgi:hypothetical protein